MSNPLKFDPARDELIRTRAYHLWENEGRPHGRAAEFWERAAELVMMEESGNPGQLPNPQAEGRDPRALEGVEEAFLQENLGEFPGQLTDQGDATQTPMAKKPTAKAKETVAEKPAKAPKESAKAAAKPAPKSPAKPAPKSAAKPAPKSSKPTR